MAETTQLDRWQLFENFINSTRLSAMDESTALSENTIMARRWDLTPFLETFTNPLILTSKDLRDWLLSHKGRWKKASTFGRKISSLKSFYGFLFREGLIEKNPAAVLEFPRQPISFQRKAFTEKQLRRVIEVAEAPCMIVRDKAIFFLLVTSGLRSTEVCSIKKSNLDLKDKMIYIPREDNKGKRVSKRVPFGEKAKAYIENYIAEDIFSDDPYLFHRHDGTPLKRMDIYCVVRDIIARAFPNPEEWSKEMGAHILRHTLATLWLESGGDRTALQHVLGHTSQSQIERYAKASTLSVEFITAASSKVQKIFKRKLNL
jgi:site-specific recombinase XerD